MACRVALVVLMVALVAAAAVAYPIDNGPYYGLGSADGGQALVGDVLDQLDQEMLMESESARRQLRQAGHIGYGALARNKVPCNQRGQSYYNCNSHQKANPYQRGCTRATRCARTNRWDQSSFVLYICACLCIIWEICSRLNAFIWIYMRRLKNVTCMHGLWGD